MNSTSFELLHDCYVFNDNEMPPVVITPSLLLYSQTCHVITCDAQGFPSENFSQKFSKIIIRGLQPNSLPLFDPEPIFFFGWVRLIMKEFEIDGLPLRQFLN